MKKLLFLIAVGALAYWLVKDRLGAETDEFVFTDDAHTAGESSETTDAV